MRRVHGITSLGFVIGAAGVALWGAFASSHLLGAAYAVAVAASFVALLAAFCAGCPCRKRCGHLFPGPVAAALFPKRTPRPYKRLELIVTCCAIFLLLGAPLGWLWREVPMLAIYVGLLLVATVQIRGSVCRGCGNTFCPAHKSL